MSSIEVKNVTVVYGAGTAFEKRALDDVSIDFGSDRVVGLIGHTGSGKSTLAMLLNGLLKPTEGRVLLDGADIWEKPREISAVRFKVGLAFQYPEYQLFEESVYKDIAFGPKNMGLQGEKLDSAVRAAARFCGIDAAYFDKSPFELSGGQKRRVAIAGVAAMEPSVLVLDEPGAGLDPAGRREIIGGLLEYRKEHKNTMIIISHSMEDIAKYADYIVVLNHGKVYMEGAPAEIFASAEKLFGASLDLPQVTKLFIELKKRGLAEQTDVYTVKEGCRRILALVEEGRRAAENTERTDQHTDQHADCHTDQRTDQHTDRRTDQHTDCHTDRRADQHTDCHADRRADQHTDCHTDRRTDQHTDRRAEQKGETQC